jgi:hypothetical protein
MQKLLILLALIFTTFLTRALKNLSPKGTLVERYRRSQGTAFNSFNKKN